MELPRPKYQTATSADAASSASNASSPTPGVLERVLVNKGDKVTVLFIYFVITFFTYFK